MCFLHGLRVSELCGMRLSDIDLVGGSVYVRRLKNSLSTQHPLFDAELPALMRWLTVRRRWRDADSDWLFLSQKGAAVAPSGPVIAQTLRRTGRRQYFGASPYAEARMRLRAGGFRA